MLTKACLFYWATGQKKSQFHQDVSPILNELVVATKTYIISQVDISFQLKCTACRESKVDFLRDVLLVLNELVLAKKMYIISQVDSKMYSLQRIQSGVWDTCPPMCESGVEHVIIYTLDHETIVEYTIIIAWRMTLRWSIKMCTYYPGYPY